MGKTINHQEVCGSLKEKVGSNLLPSVVWQFGWDGWLLVGNEILCTCSILFHQYSSSLEIPGHQTDTFAQSLHLCISLVSYVCRSSPWFLI